MINSLPAKQEMQVGSLGWEDLLEKEMATHPSIPAWRIPGTEEPGGLQSKGWQSRTRLSLSSCVNFCCKQSDPVTYIHVSPLFGISFLKTPF